MKANEVMRVLRISRCTLGNYLKAGKIKASRMPNGQWNYDETSVYDLLNAGVKRKTYVYARVSTSKQKPDLLNQIELLKQFCFSNSYVLSGVFQDIASGISFEKRKEFFDMLDDVLDGKVERVVITYKDRLSRVGFDLFKYLFKRCNCEIVVMSEIGSEKLDAEDISDEVVSLLRCYNTQLCSDRHIKQLKEVLKSDDCQSC